MKKSFLLACFVLIFALVSCGVNQPLMRKPGLVGVRELGPLKAGGIGGIGLAWDPNTETDLAGYNIYYGAVARTGTDPKLCTLCGYTTRVPLGLVTTYRASGLTTGTTYWFSVSAFDASNNESAFSNQVSGQPIDTTPPVDPKNMKIVP